MNMQCNKTNPTCEISSVKDFLRNICLDQEDKIVQNLELRNVKTVYDFLRHVSYLTVTSCTGMNNDENVDITSQSNVKFASAHESIFQNGVSVNGKLTQQLAQQLAQHNGDGGNPGEAQLCNGHTSAGREKGDRCNGVQRNGPQGGGKLANGVSGIGVSSNGVSSNGMDGSAGRDDPAAHSESTQACKEIAAMRDYYEQAREKRSGAEKKGEYVYFDMYIKSEVIKTLPTTDRDKERLINYIYKVMDVNDLLMMCIHFGLPHLWPKFEQSNIRNVELFKRIIIEGRKFERVKNEMGISFSEFVQIVNFTLSVKKKRIFCNNIFSQFDPCDCKNKKKHTKTICDKIHQFIEFDNWTFKNIIDNPFFQRLRNLSQLGVCQFVYPGATHTRFEHSLGVGYLSAKYFAHLCNRYNLSPYSGELNKMLRCVQIAGLCHDLGHGPFSHTFESFFMNYKKEETDHKWNHASMSLKIVEHVIENLIDQDDVLDSTDIKIIKKLIKGREHHKSVCGVDPVDSLIEASYDIICNNRNGLDADKFDYLQRDATIAPPNGTLPSLNCNRIISQSSVINGHITYNVKEIHPVWTVYMNRFSLFKQVYTHRKVRVMELMLCDGFRLADDIFKWSESLHDLDAFLDLTDSSIIYDIKKRANKHKYDEKVQKSLNLINSVIHDRNSNHAYKYISEINLSEPQLIKYLKDIANEERIARYAHGLSPDDIIIDWNYLNYGMGANDPLDSVYFYSSDNEDEAFIAHKEYRGTHPRYFEECNVRLYCKNKMVAHLAKDAHNKFLSDVFSESSPLYKKKIVK
ncbi:HD superfamily phosphohydrolase protein [Plasmodium vivax]|uniref:HD superfamily phosphohydrolase protein n=2 Tax=Plasmodium vivax TaxID=5855 RepID=A0A1G4H5R6_PLAVI|nr:HD domain-containing protein [Plasmodium vivax North Korean]SCO70147.1 HD superfamily phosphohydrolase protein [Plasmodium vivax]